jgi:gamma-glutamyltranspeptidase/glutathione hydrolase
MEGIEYVYDGLGHAIDRLMAERGGLLTLADLRAYPGSLRWVEPLRTTYRGVPVYTSPPPTSAIQVLETLNILAGFDLGATDHLGPEHIGLVAEASRAARLDTDRHASDPAGEHDPEPRPRVRERRGGPRDRGVLE